MARLPLVPLERLQSYGQVRDRVEDGDVFLFRGQFLISKLFEKVDFSYYSHAALSAWWGDRLMILQAEGPGIQAIPMSVAVATYPGRVDWYKLKKDAFPECGTKLAAVLVEAKSDLGLAYGFGDLLRNIWHWIAKIKLADPVYPRAMFCSEYVERCFRTGGMSLTGKPDITTFPKDIAASQHLEYMATIPHVTNDTDARDRDAVPK
ncbi:MAG TPA: hypothetical protein VMS88_07405 [Terriglobales bacterium]|nr:hypothetical protein [Terriglobales bacterium]